MLDIIKRIGAGAVVLALAVPISWPFILAAKLENNSMVAVISWKLAMLHVRRKIRRVFEEIKREL